MNIPVRDSSVSALLMGQYKNDRLLVHEVFGKLKWRLFEAQDHRRAMQCLREHPVHVVLVENDAPTWNWKQVLHDLRTLAPSPQLIVTSRTADEYLWAEALNLGAYDVLAQPFERDELERVVTSAYRHFDVQPERAGRLNAIGVGAA